MVEGDKMAIELLQFSPNKIDTIFALESWVKTNESTLKYAINKTITVSPSELKKISTLKTPNKVLMIVDFYEFEEIKLASDCKTVLYLDGIQDPGNMGTILRTADWFGISTVFCSNDSVDLYNPKVIQSSMGAFMRVAVHSLELADIKAQFPELSLYGTVLEGESLYEAALQTPCLVAIGNEGNGIKPENLPLFDKKLSIPKSSRSKAESLNAGIATGVLCAFISNQAKLF